MNANINPISTRAFHPSRVDSNAIHALARWLKANSPQPIRQSELLSVMNERYPAGLFSEDELQALCELATN